MAATEEDVPYHGYCPIPHSDNKFHAVPGTLRDLSMRIWEHVRDEHIIPFLEAVVQKHAIAATREILSPESFFVFSRDEVAEFAVDSERLLQRLKTEVFTGANYKPFWNEVYKRAHFLLDSGYAEDFTGDLTYSARRQAIFLGSLFVRMSFRRENPRTSAWRKRWYEPDDGVGNALRIYSRKYTQMREHHTAPKGTFMIFIAARRYFQDAMGEKEGMVPLVFADDSLSQAAEEELLGIPSTDVDISRPATADDILGLGDISGDITEEQLEDWLSTQSLDSVAPQTTVGTSESVDLLSGDETQWYTEEMGVSATQTSFEDLLPPVTLPPGGDVEQAPLFSDDPMRMAAARALVKHKGNVKAAARALLSIR